MKFIKKEYLLYEIYSLVSVFVLLILAGLLKFLFRTFSLYLEDCLDFEFTFLIVIHLYFLLSPFAYLKLFSKRKLSFLMLLIVLLINCLVFFIIGFFTTNASGFIFITTVVFYITIPFLFGQQIFSKKANFIKKLAFLSSFVAIVLFNYNLVHPIILQKQNFGSISGTYSKSIDIKLVSFKDENGDVYNLDDQIVYLDFWNNTCGVCIKKFPLVQDFANDLENKQFYLVNVFENKDEIQIAKKILKDRNVGVKNIFLNKKDLSHFDVHFYPTVIKVVDDEIVFKGSIETLPYFNLIERLYSLN